jgi:hypothetical protein
VLLPMVSAVVVWCKPALLDHIHFDQFVRITILANWFTGLRAKAKSLRGETEPPFAS